MNRNGLSFIALNPKKYDEFYVEIQIRKKLEDQYIQSWDDKALNTPKLQTLYHLKKNNYKRSLYLSDTVDIDMRRRITKLRVGGSKLATHSFIYKKEKCRFCDLEAEDTKHFILNCPRYRDIRTVFFSEVDNCKQNVFKHYTDQTKLCSILSQTLYDCTSREKLDKYRNLCLKFVKDISDIREAEDTQ